MNTMKPLVLIGISIILLLEENLASATDQPDETSAKDPTSATTQPDDASEYINPPALTCVVLGDAACDRMCKMVGRIYAAPVNQATCNTSNNCECSMRQHTFLDDLWKEKFSPVELLDTIKVDRKRYEDILTVIMTPFQTREQTKNNLEKFMDPKDFQQIKVNDNVSENMVKNNGRGAFDQDIIRIFVNHDLQSDPLQVPADFDFKLRLRNALENTPDTDIAQYIINDVRRSKNAVLNELVDAFIKEKNFTGSNVDDDDDDTLTDILDLLIVDEFISPKPITNDNPETSTPVPETNEIVPSVQSDSDYELPNLDVPSVQEFKDGYKCWDNENPDYRVCQFKAVWGEHQVWWKKGKDSVAITVQDTGEIVQEWKLDNVKINMTRKPNGDLEQIWNFAPDTQLMYVQSGDAADQFWANDKEDQEAWAKYKSLIDLWCDKNSVFIDRDSCVIYGYHTSNQSLS